MHTLLLCALVASSTAMRTHPAKTMEPISFLAQTPTGVAGIMAKVEQRWLEFALTAAGLDCNATQNAANCSTDITKNYASENFTQSCFTVSKAIVQTSAGDRSRVQSYMSNVCGQDSLKGKPEELCLDFSQYLVKEMSEYQHQNLEGSMDLTSVCTDFFKNGYLGHYAEEQRKAWADADAARQVELQRKADLAEQEQANAEVEAKAALARKRLEAMQNATAQADARRQEAVASAVKAQRSAEESEAAVELQKRMKAQAEEAQKQFEAAKAKAEVITRRVNGSDATTTNQSAVEANENHNSTAKSFLAVAPFTFS